MHLNDIVFMFRDQLMIINFLIYCLLVVALFFKLYII